ncbi:uncharacterized protein [Onthophagus taurus]|uniref:uncharacterized protein n=1 Tax=Onthophagus taurus TaxID=166361 RepID=UPI0039BDD7C0
MENLLSSVKLFVNLCETKTWLKTAQNEELKNAFKLGLFLEKSVSILKTKCLQEKFDLILKESEIKTCCGDLEKSCDELLEIILTYQFVSFNNTDAAFRIYTSMFPQDGFKNVLTKTIINNNSLKLINDFTFKIDRIELESSALFGEFFEYASNEDFYNIKICVKTLLESDENALKIVFKLLSIESNNRCVQDIVFLEIKEKLIDYNEVNHKIWFFICNNLNQTDLLIVCKHHEEFIYLIINFLIHLGTFMIFKHKKWVIDPKKSSFEIKYLNIVALFRTLCSIGKEIRNDLIKKVLNSNNLKLWNNVLHDC